MKYKQKNLSVGNAMGLAQNPVSLLRIFHKADFGYWNGEAHMKFRLSKKGNILFICKVACPVVQTEYYTFDK